MKLKSFDHIVLCIRDIDATVAFYRDILGMDPREGKPGKWDLHFGDGKISLQTPETIPDMAKGTLPGTGNFCLVTETPVENVAAILKEHGVKILTGPGKRSGAVGDIMSVYFNDPDGNLLEVCNRL